MKNCKEETKFNKAVIDSKRELKSVSLPPAFKPLGLDTPNGHTLTKERREIIKSARKKVVDCERKYRSHINNCFVCKNSITSN